MRGRVRSDEEGDAALEEATWRDHYDDATRAVWVGLLNAVSDGSVRPLLTVGTTRE
ncbi:hypothetical protein [Natrinema salaciae]|uniref:hypothetical protein n=1 Tax=Natrinema salaciae TaxID=1186196 RepID=UPI001587E583|nr:hypothetical protein [Natrinema salaciae]